MNASADRLEFAPPPQPGTARAMVLAVIAHLLLMLALTWGINWNRESENIAAEAELWSAVPQQAAPAPVEAPPPPPPPPRPVEQKKVEAPPPPAPTVKEPDIAQEREKKKQELAKQRAVELEKQKKVEAKRKLEEQKREDQKREQLAEKKAAEDRKKQEELAKAAKEKTKQLADAKRAEALRSEALRKENLARMQALAGATGGATATGTALRSSGPSDSYAGRIRARVRPNIVFTDDIAGNPTAEVEVRMAPDGTITSTKVVKSSGVKSWDNAVLRALDKTETLPRDADGRVHTPLIIEFKPKG